MREHLTVINSDPNSHLTSYNLIQGKKILLLKHVTAVSERIRKVTRLIEISSNLVAALLRKSVTYETVCKMTPHLSQSC